MKKNFIKKHSFLLIFIATAVLLRIYLISLPGFTIDVTSFEAWAGRLADVGPTHFYAPGYFADYFPGYLYMLWFLAKVFLLLSHASIYSTGFEHYLKFFTNLFDFGTAYLIYKIISKKSQEWGLIGAFLYLINPAVSFNSSVWGQVDGISTFFLLASAYLLLEIKKLRSFSIIAGLSFIVKPQGISALSILGVYFLRFIKPNRYWFLLLAPLTAIIAAAPFFPSDPVFGLYHLFFKSSSVYPYTSMFAYNFWSFAGWWQSDTTVFLGLTYNIWGYVLFAAAMVIILLPLLKKYVRENHNIVYLAMALSIFAFFLFPTRIHERYLAYIFPFLLIFAVWHKNIKYIFIYILLSIFHFINIWYVYYYYNYVFNNPLMGSLPAFQFLSNNYNLFTILDLALFFLLLGIYYKGTFKQTIH